MAYDPASYWPERYARQGDLYVAKGGRRDSYDAQLDGIAPYLGALPQVGEVLDYGCGPGRFRGVLEARGLTWRGYDIIPGLGNIGSRELADSAERFMGALAIFVLQHIPPEPKAEALELIYDALAPGGKFLVVDHNPIPHPAEHMHPTGFQPIDDAQPWDGWVLDYWDDHWVGVFVKR